LLIIPLALIIPTLEIPISSSIASNYIIEPSGFEPTTEIMAAKLNELKSADVKDSVFIYLNIFYWLGVGVSMTLFVLNILRLLHIRRLSNKVKVDGFTILTSSTPAIFSSFKWIFVPKDMPLNQVQPIIKHEQAHVRKLHTIDLLMVELFAALLWFNPFIYLFKNLLKAVHEYQADAHVLSSNISKSNYLAVLLKNLSPKNGHSLTESSAGSLASSFKNSHIKNRIKMMTKNKSTRIQSIKYLLILPIISGLLLAFTPITGNEMSYITFTGEVPSIFPIQEGLYKKISSPYGVTRKDPFTKEMKKHTGMDIVADTGTPILATGSGKVIKAGEYGFFGNMIVIDHGEYIQTMYAHLNKVNVKEGDLVNTEDVIGEVGSTGKSTAPHLHYEVHKNGKRVNPSEYYGK
jgi:murein DD-endopeptidase MepM/ murein hydrolase activator NlpD